MKELAVHETPNNIECGIIDLSLVKHYWALFTIYSSIAQFEKCFCYEIGKELDFAEANMSSP